MQQLQSSEEQENTDYPITAIDYAPNLSDGLVSPETAAALETSNSPSGVSTAEQLAAREEIRSWLDFLALRRSRRIDPVYAGLAAFIVIATQWFRSAHLNDFYYYAFVAYAALLPLLTIYLVRQIRISMLREQDVLVPSAGCGAWIGPIVEALTAPQRRVRAAAERMILKVLPRVTAADFAAMTGDEHDHLYQYVGRLRTGNSEVGAAILLTLARLGDSQSIPALEPIASGRAWRPLAIRDLADSAITSIRQRIVAQAQFTTVGNRAAMATDVAPIYIEGSRPNGANDIASQINVLEAQLEALRSVSTIAAPAATVDPLIQQMEKELQRSATPSLRPMFLYAGWAVALPWAGIGIVNAATDRDAPTAVAYAAVLFLALILPRWALSQKLRAAARGLAKCNDHRVVGKLVQMLDWPDESVKRSASQALARLLPRLQASDRDLLSEDNRRSLCAILRLADVGSDRPLIMSILRAFEQVGDERCLRAVERLADSIPKSRAQREVQEQAQRCREFLTVRTGQNRLSQTLLRASDSGAAPFDTLVRPVMQAPVAAPEQLLRAGTGPDDSAGKR